VIYAAPVEESIALSKQASKATTVGLWEGVEAHVHTDGIEDDIRTHNEYENILMTLGYPLRRALSEVGGKGQGSPP